MAYLSFVSYIFLLFCLPKGSWNKLQNIRKLVKYVPYCIRYCAINSTCLFAFLKVTFSHFNAISLWYHFIPLVSINNHFYFKFVTCNKYLNHIAKYEKYLSHSHTYINIYTLIHWRRNIKVPKCLGIEKKSWFCAIKTVTWYIPPGIYLLKINNRQGVKYFQS